MVYIVINAVPILLATLAGLVAGFAYRRATFGARAHASPGLLFAVVLAELWLAAILAGAIILAPTQAGRWIMAIGSAVVIWIGFVVPALVGALGMRGVGAAGIVRDCGYWLLVMVTQAVVLRGVGVVAPPA